MAGGGASGIDESQFTGIRKIFNSYTDRGRANVSKATLGGLALLTLYLYLKPKRKS